MVQMERGEHYRFKPRCLWIPIFYVFRKVNFGYLVGPEPFMWCNNGQQSIMGKSKTDVAWANDNRCVPTRHVYAMPDTSSLSTGRVESTPIA